MVLRHFERLPSRAAFRPANDQDVGSESALFDWTEADLEEWSGLPGPVDLRVACSCTDQ